MKILNTPYRLSSVLTQKVAQKSIQQAFKGNIDSFQSDVSKHSARSFQKKQPSQSINFPLMAVLGGVGALLILVFWVVSRLIPFFGKSKALAQDKVKSEVLPQQGLVSAADQRLNFEDVKELQARGVIPRRDIIEDVHDTRQIVVQPEAAETLQTPPRAALPSFGESWFEMTGKLSQEASSSDDSAKVVANQPSYSDTDLDVWWANAQTARVELPDSERATVLDGAPVKGVPKGVVSQDKPLPAKASSPAYVIAPDSTQELEPQKTLPFGVRLVDLEKGNAPSKPIEALPPKPASPFIPSAPKGDKPKDS